MFGQVAEAMGDEDDGLPFSHCAKSLEELKLSNWIHS